jgi:hypothetical protein
MCKDLHGILFSQWELKSWFSCIINYIYYNKICIRFNWSEITEQILVIRSLISHLIVVWFYAGELYELAV